MTSLAWTRTLETLKPGSLLPAHTVQSGSFSVPDNPQCMRKCDYMEAQLRVHVMSSKAMGSRDRLPVFTSGPREGSGLVFEIHSVMFI